MQEYNDLFKRPTVNKDDDLEQSKTKIFDKDIDEIIRNKGEDVFSDLYRNKEDLNVVSEKTVKKDMPKRKKKNKKVLPTIVRVLIMVAISVGLALAIIFSAIDLLGLTFNNDKTAEIEIKSGYSTAQIADELKDKGVIRYPILFRIYSKLQGGDGTYQYGVYEIKDSQSYGGIINALQQPGETGEIVTITIPEGYSVKKIATLMEENGVCSKDEFISAVKNAEYDYDFIKDIPTHSVYYRLEGYLYPDTYQFFINSDGNSGESCAKKAVNKMLQRMDDFITDEVRANAEKRGYTVHEILTMASVVELEASGYPDDMAKVAQVFYNRLKWEDQPALLGSTPTSEYPDSRYDTNKYEGLPPGPLCSPSSDAIESALNPDTSVKEDYFVTDKNMRFYYTSSLSEHNELIERLKSEGLWN